VRGLTGHGWDVLAGTDVTAAARALLGCELHGGDVAVRLTEVEAYAGQADPASHAYRGRTARTQIMFGPAGPAYVYFVFGVHWCVNLVCGPTGQAAAVLLRAGEVVAGADVVRQRRGGAPAHRDLARGPARLTVALGIDGRVNGTSLIDGSGPVTLVPAARPVGSRIESGPRVGVAAAADVPWRYWLHGEPTVSPYRRHSPRRSVPLRPAAPPAAR
jgi:DNA-3-methyladenine glycosylase